MKQNNAKLGALSVFLAIFFAFVLAQSGQAVERFVPSQYATIQAAINAAADGDIITVDDGTYTGDGNRDIDFNGKAITLRSKNGPDNCIINCQGDSIPVYLTRRGFFFHNGEDENSVLDGFTIMDGRANEGGCLLYDNGELIFYPGGLTITGGDGLVITDFDSLNCFDGSSGGAICCQGSGPTIINCIVTDNTAGEHGGGIYCDMNSNAIIIDCIFKNNAAGEGDGGGVCSQGSSTILKNCTIEGNITRSSGGGVFCGEDTSYNTGNSPQIIGCMIKNNAAKYGGGIYAGKTEKLRIDNSVLANNSASVSGGGIYCNISDDAQIANCTFANNAAKWGGGIFTDSNPIIANCILWNNIATDSGHEAYNYSASPTFRCCDIAGGINGPGLSGELGVFSIDSGGNINIDPKFENAPNGCYQLLIGSPCVDAGNNSAVAGTDTDIAGNPRIHGPKIDIGAYENQYPLPQYSLTASVTGNRGTVDPGSGIYDCGTEVTLTVVPKAGYSVKAWYGADISTTSSTNTVTMNSNKIVTIECKLIPCNLTAYVVGQHGSISPTEGTYDYGSVVFLTAAPNNGYRVRIWHGTDNDSSANNTNTVTIDSSMTVTVEFEPIPYGLDAYVIGGHGIINPSSGVYNFGTVLALAANPDEGYQVKEWHGTDYDSSANNTNTVTMDSDKEVSVEFEQVPVGLTILVPSGHGVVPGASGSYGVGSLVDITATPDSGYRVEGWYTANDVLLSTEDTIEVLMDSDKIISVIFEKIPDTITLSKCVIKAGKSRVVSSDTITITGSSLDTTIADFSKGHTIYVGIFNESEDTPVFSEEIIFSASNLKNGTLNYRGSNGRITSLKCDINNNTFSITAKNISLTGLSSPVAVEIEIGDYFGDGVAYDGEVLGSGGNADIINGKQLMPIQLLSGYEDSLRIDKCTFNLGTKASADSLTIQGAIAVEDTSVDIAGEDVAISWGDYDIILPANDLYRIGTGKIFKYKKPKGTNSSIAVAIFDLEKCTFKIIVKNADISQQGNPIDFSMQFADFSKTVTLQLTEKTSDSWSFP